jgi:hypothetical protein
MPRTRKLESQQHQNNVFINVPVTRETRQGLIALKESMGVDSQGDVIRKLVAIGLAIEKASKG